MASQLPSNPGIHETIKQSSSRFASLSVTQSAGQSSSHPRQQVLKSVSQSVSQYVSESVLINLFFPVNPPAPLRFKSINSQIYLVSY